MTKFRRDVYRYLVQIMARAAGSDWTDEWVLQYGFALARMARNQLSRKYVSAMRVAVEANRLTKQEAIEQAAFVVLVSMRDGMVGEALPEVSSYATRCRSCGKFYPYILCPDCEREHATPKCWCGKELISVCTPDFIGDVVGEMEVCTSHYECPDHGVDFEAEGEEHDADPS